MDLRPVACVSVEGYVAVDRLLTHSSLGLDLLVRLVTHWHFVLRYCGARGNEMRNKPCKVGSVSS